MKVTLGESWLVVDSGSVTDKKQAEQKQDGNHLAENKESGNDGDKNSSQNEVVKVFQATATTSVATRTAEVSVSADLSPMKSDAATETTHDSSSEAHGRDSDADEKQIAELSNQIAALEVDLDLRDSQISDLESLLKSTTELASKTTKNAKRIAENASAASTKDQKHINALKEQIAQLTTVLVAYKRKSAALEAKVRLDKEAQEAERVQKQKEKTTAKPTHKKKKEKDQIVLTLSDFQIGDTALFLNDGHGNFAAKNVNTPHYYVSQETIESCKIKKAPFFMGELITIDPITLKSNNPYRLKAGTVAQYCNAIPIM